MLIIDNNITQTNLHVVPWLLSSIDSIFTNAKGQEIGDI